MTNKNLKFKIENSPKYTLAIGVSGTGTTFEAIYQAIKSGQIVLDLALVFADRECLGLERAKKFGLKTILRQPLESIADFHKRVIAELNKLGVDVVTLAGYLRLFPITNEDSFLVLNSHPAATPEFGGTGFWGIRVHDAVLKFARATNFRHPYTYSTIHIATAEYDMGQPIGQKKLELLKADTPETLAQRLLPIEHQNYTEVLKRFSEGVVEYQNSPKDLVLANEQPILRKIRREVLAHYEAK